MGNSQWNPGKKLYGQELGNAFLRIITFECKLVQILER